MLVHGLISKNIETYGVIKLNKFSEKYLNNPTDFYISENHKYEALTELSTNSKIKSSNDKVLFKILIAERKKLAKSKNIPPYVIFQESSIDEMSIKYPLTIEELKNINGVGEGKAKKFGHSFIKIISDYVQEFNITRPEDLVIKTSGLNSSLKMFLIQSIDRKIPLDDIAENKNLELEELIKELETIVFSGTKLNIDYVIDDYFDEDQQDDLYDFFIETESDDINIAIDEFGDEFEESDLRIYRLKFISDISN